jgi:hypothetical protein
MKKLAMAFVAGMVTMYFLDPEQGPVRRRRWAEWWDHSRPVLQQTGQDVATTARQIGVAGRGLGDRVARTADCASSRLRARLAR